MSSDEDREPDGKRQKTDMTCYYSPNQLQQQENDGNNNNESSTPSCTIIWRLDPIVSFSDYCIEIESKESGSKRLYHVHKICLVFGEYQSEYFSCVFRHQQQQGSDDGHPFADTKTGSIISIQLENDTVADCFPCFLDILYTGELFHGEEAEYQEMPPGKTMLIRHLAGYFRVPKLVDELTKSALRHMGGNLPEYLPWIIMFQNEPSIESVCLRAKHHIVNSVFLDETIIGVCFPTDIDDVDGDSYSVDSDQRRESERRLQYLQELVIGMDVNFVKEVLRFCDTLITSRALVAETEDCSPSILVAQFVSAHKEHLSKDDFEELVHRRFIPKIASGVAMQLLENEFDFLGIGTAISDMQKRCLDALLIVNTNYNKGLDETGSVLKKLSSPKLVDLLSREIQHRMNHGTTTMPAPRTELKPVRHHIRTLSTNPIFKDFVFVHNGSYYRANGQWKGYPATFHIQLRHHWFLACDYENYQEDDVTDVLYTHEEMYSEHPPAWGWERNEPGLPPIFLLFCRGELGITWKR